MRAGLPKSGPSFEAAKAVALPPIMMLAMCSMMMQRAPSLPMSTEETIESMGVICGRWLAERKRQKSLLLSRETTLDHRAVSQHSALGLIVSELTVKRWAALRQTIMSIGEDVCKGLRKPGVDRYFHVDDLPKTSAG